MSCKKFTEHDPIYSELQDVIEFMLFLTMKRYDITYCNPPHDIARRFLNEICEFEPGPVQDQKARKRAAREVRENADKSG